MLSREQGKPLTAATGEVIGASVWFSYFAKLQLDPEILLDDDKKRIQVVRKPLGVVAAITPWNFPLILLSWKLAPAFLAGNTVVAKPSPYTPLTSLLLAETLREILPPGVLNVLSGGNELGAQIAGHPLARKISFTGSVATGKKIMAVAADDLKRVTLELGGNDPAIVLDDVNPEQILDGLFWGAFQNSGQVCTAIKRLYIHERVYEPIRAGLIARARAVKVGRGLDPDTQLGPINNEMQLGKLTELVEDAKRNGATIETGGARLESPGYFYPADDRHRRARAACAWWTRSSSGRRCRSSSTATSTTRSSRPTARTTGWAHRCGAATRRVPRPSSRRSSPGPAG